MSVRRGQCGKRLSQGATCECLEYAPPDQGASCACCSHHANYHCAPQTSNPILPGSGVSAVSFGTLSPQVPIPSLTPTAPSLTPTAPNSGGTLGPFSQRRLVSSSAMTEVDRLFQPYHSSVPDTPPSISQSPNNSSSDRPSATASFVTGSTETAIPQPPRINLTRLRNLRYQKPRRGGKQGSRGGRQSSSSSQQRESQQPGSQHPEPDPPKLYKGIYQLPRRFKFMVLPYNELEARKVPMYIPRKGEELHRSMIENRMIQDVDFLYGDPANCLEAVTTAFAHLELREFRFYRPSGRSQGLNAVTSDITYQNFDLETLIELASGGYVPKKIYIGPVAPQSFATLDGSDESDSDDEFEDPSNSNTPVPSSSRHSVPSPRSEPSAPSSSHTPTVSSSASYSSTPLPASQLPADWEQRIQQAAVLAMRTIFQQHFQTNTLQPNTPNTPSPASAEVTRIHVPIISNRETSHPRRRIRVEVPTPASRMRTTPEAASEAMPDFSEDLEMHSISPSPELMDLFPDSGTLERVRESFIHPDVLLQSFSDLLANERRRATIPFRIADDNRFVWDLRGDPDLMHQISTLMSLLAHAEPQEFRHKPRVLVPDSVTYDAGGVTADKVNKVFEYIINTEIFVRDETTSTVSFANVDTTPDSERSYLVFGIIFYWYVFIYPMVPFPFSVNPAILAYSIYGYIPICIVNQQISGLARISEIIRHYPIDITMEQIDDEVLQWLDHMELPYEEFVEQLRDASMERDDLVRRMGNDIIIGESKAAFDKVREGFQRISGFTSHLHLTNFEDVQSHFAQTVTTPETVGRLLNFRVEGERRQYNLRDTNRTKSHLRKWVTEASSEMLVRFVQAVTGQLGLTDGLRTIDVVYRASRTTEENPLPDLVYFTPKFETCFNTIRLPGWPINRPFSEFKDLMDNSVIACNNAFTQL